MDRFLTTSEARQKFLNLVDDVEEGDQVMITKHRVPKAAIISFEELQTLKAVARLWQDPEAYDPCVWLWNTRKPGDRSSFRELRR